jgi:cell wall assembly regulator SMI1
MKVTNSQVKLTTAKIEQLELEAGISLPDDYKAFLLKHNGGEPNVSKFKTKDSKVESYVSFFLPITSMVEDNLLEEIEGITHAGQIPANLIPIASDPADNRIVLSVDGDDCGKVYYWAWDEEVEDHVASYKRMRLIAESFSDFLALMH